jgi:hypothetical protein
MVVPEIFYNSSGSFGLIIDAWTYNVTGDLYLTLVSFVLLLFAFCLMFKIPIEFTAIIVLPMMIVAMAWSSQFLAIGGLTLIYIGVLVAKWFIIK